VGESPASVRPVVVDDSIGDGQFQFAFVEDQVFGNYCGIHELSGDLFDWGLDVPSDDYGLRLPPSTRLIERH
jgi:hypothetical protein